MIDSLPGWLINCCIVPSCRLRQVVPTALERSIDSIDLSPSLAAGSSSGLLWHCWLRGHAHQRPRTLFPPTVLRARTVHALPALLLAVALYTLDCDWPSVATRRCVLWVLFFFFFFPFFPSSLCFTHTAERKRQAVREKKPTSNLAQYRQQHWQPPSLCSILALTTKKSDI